MTKKHNRNKKHSNKGQAQEPQRPVAGEAGGGPGAGMAGLFEGQPGSDDEPIGRGLGEGENPGLEGSAWAGAVGAASAGEYMEHAETDDAAGEESPLESDELSTRPRGDRSQQERTKEDRA